MIDIATPIGFSFQDFADTTVFSLAVVLILIANAIGLPPARGLPLICFSATRILYFPASKYLVSKLLPVLFPGLLNPTFLIITSSPPALISRRPLPISFLPPPARLPI